MRAAEEESVEFAAREANAAWLTSFLDMPHGPPTQDIFLVVFAALDPEAFSWVFRAWAALLVLGQRKTEEKSNEITAIPELMRVLDIKDATVTIDAMGCQTEIAKTIVDGKGDYLIAVKDNQPTLRQDIEKTFTEAADDRTRSCDELPRPVVEVFEEHDKGHGRVEKRTVQMCRYRSFLTTVDKWPGLAFVAQVLREMTVLSTGKTSTETAYYIGSDGGASAIEVGCTIRRLAQRTIPGTRGYSLSTAIVRLWARRRNASPSMNT